MRRIGLLLFALSVSVAASGELPRGEITTVEVKLDAEHSYALYLPSTYDPARKYPILYCLDARSRGDLVAAIFRDAAEEFDWILACSNNTMSDGAFEPNVVAFRYLWYDTHERLSIDDRRIYATGFSGLSRFLWNLPAMNVPLAGAIGVGGSLPWTEIPEMEIGFSYFGLVGTEDFNWAEMHLLGEKLAERDVPFRLAVFEGDHRWPGSDTATLAVRWMELDAVRRGLREPAEGEIGKSLEADRSRVATLLEERRDAEAHDLLEAIRRDYSGLVETLELPVVDQRRLKRAVEARDRLAKEETRWIGSAQRPIAILLQPGAARSETFRAAKELDLAGWRKKSESSDVDLSRSAKRRLSTIFGQLSYYLPNMFLDRGEPQRALTALELAGEIRGDHPQVHYQRARALTALGEEDAAIGELETALRLLGRSGSALADDENFEALAQNERFQALIREENANDPTDIE